MKHLILFFLFISSYVFSQVNITKTLGEFSTLKVYDLINVELIKSDTNKIMITGQNISDVSIIQKNDLLKIRMNTKKMFNGNQTQVKLFYTAIDVIDANEGAVINSKDPINQYELTLKTQEGAEISALADTKLLNIKCFTGGVVSVSGTTELQKLSLRTGGIYLGSNLVSEYSNVNIKTGGEAHVKTQKDLDIRIFSGGDVFIYGKPKKINQKRLFGGRVIFKD